jgi:serine/threonine-protein kinase RsbW
MTNIAAKRILLPTELDRLVELEEIVAEMLAHVVAAPDLELVQYNVVLALHELCVNIIKHAYAGKKDQFSVMFELRCDPTLLQIDTYDDGPHKFDMAGWQTPDLDDPPIHGLGVFLMRQLMDEVAYETTPSGNHWRLVKFLPEAEPANV